MVPLEGSQSGREGFWNIITKYTCSNVGMIVARPQLFCRQLHPAIFIFSIPNMSAAAGPGMTYAWCLHSLHTPCSIQQPRYLLQGQVRADDHVWVPSAPVCPDQA